VYAREIDDREFTFGVSGKLIRNVLVMYDRQTESLWSQLLGEAVSGEMIGTKLQYLPTWLTTWGDWKEIHPESLALEKDFRARRDPYTSYYQSGSTGVIGETFNDDRLAAKELVIGVELDGKAIVYPVRTLNGEPVINDTLADHDILVVYDQNSANSLVYDRRLDQQTLTFKLSEAPTLVMTDEETHSTWDALSGEAISGPLAGQSLDRVKSTIVFWFGWKDFFPATLIYGLDSG
jgi:hypothetical protein